MQYNQQHPPATSNLPLHPAKMLPTPISPHFPTVEVDQIAHLILPGERSTQPFSIGAPPAVSPVLKRSIPSSPILSSRKKMNFKTSQDGQDFISNLTLAHGNKRPILRSPITSPRKIQHLNQSESQDSKEFESSAGRIRGKSPIPASVINDSIRLEFNNHQLNLQTQSPHQLEFRDALVGLQAQTSFQAVAAESLNAPSAQSSSSDLLKSISATQLPAPQDLLSTQALLSSYQLAESPPATTTLTQSPESTLSSIRAGSKRKRAPFRSIPHSVMVNKTPLERESDGIMRLDVYDTFRQEPSSLLATMDIPSAVECEHEYRRPQRRRVSGRSGFDDEQDLFASPSLLVRDDFVSTRLRTVRRRSSEISVSGSSTTPTNADRLGSASLVNGIFNQGLPSSSGKRRRPPSPSKPVFPSYNPQGGSTSGVSQTPRQRAIPSSPIKAVSTSGDGSNDKTRPLPFPLIDAAEVEEFTVCKDPGDTVTWKKTPISFESDSEGYSKLAPDELETCSILRVPPVDYLQVKLILLSARKEFQTFTKRQAQKWYGIDVNKTGKIFDWFVSKNWLLVSDKAQKKK